MANSTEGYSRIILLQYLVRSARPGILILAGLMIQLFIVAVNITDWMKGKPMTEADKIITSLGVSRIFFHLSCLLGLFAVFSLSHSLYVFLVSNIFIEFSAFSGLWLSTLLSVFKGSSTFHNVFFLRLKAIISRRVTFLIIASVLFFHPLHYFYFHMNRMNNHANALGSTDTYHRTMKFTVFSFLACALYATIYLFQVFKGFLDILWLCFLLNIFPVLHSVLLVYVVTKLRNQFFRIVLYGTGCLWNKKAPEPSSRELVEVTPL
uniref:Taste receptor type 2 n=1 Tax=Pyxicephalus adspersus TaxID=30357 RepID=A0AAV3AG07_PYXAD|nr:TPA: hypothetical protein GDO54_009892 [Pyxicephalus adspersus]